MNINDSFDKLINIYDTLDEDSKEKFEKICFMFVELMNEQKDRANMYKYFSRKLNRDKTRYNTSLNFLELRNYIAHNRSIPNYYYRDIEKIIWKILPEIKSFYDIKELNNFLSYIFDYEFKPHKRLKDKKKLVKIYKQVYDSLSFEEKEQIIQELIMRLFAEIDREELEAILKKKRLK